MTPIIKRVPVPEFPKSSGPCGWRRPPGPRPLTSQTSPTFAATAPSATTARAVLMTSSASSRPRMRVVPVASAPKISARCEIDLSPGTRRRPRSGGARIADIGFAFEAFKKSQSRAAPRAESPVRHGQSSAIQALAARLCQRHRACSVKVALTQAAKAHFLILTGSIAYGRRAP